MLKHLNIFLGNVNVFKLYSMKLITGSFYKNKYTFYEKKFDICNVKRRASVPAPVVTPVALPVNDTNVI
jgi:hypothetical protein